MPGQNYEEVGISSTMEKSDNVVYLNGNLFNQNQW